MAKITIAAITSAFTSTAAINARFQQIADWINDKSFSKDSDGNSNAMTEDLDMAGNDLLNVGNIDELIAARWDDALTATFLSKDAATLQVVAGPVTFMNDITFAGSNIFRKTLSSERMKYVGFGGWELKHGNTSDPQVILDNREYTFGLNSSGTKTQKFGPLMFRTVPIHSGVFDSLYASTFSIGKVQVQTDDSPGPNTVIHDYGWLGGSGLAIGEFTMDNLTTLIDFTTANGIFMGADAYGPVADGTMQVHFNGEILITSRAGKVNMSGSKAIQIPVYANLAAITAASLGTDTNQLVKVTGQGLATYNGANWVLASDDTTLVT